MIELFETARAAVDTELGPVNGIAGYISAALNWILPLVGGLALLTIIYAGYIYITSQGNPDALGKAKDIIIGTLTGIILLFLIKLILIEIGIQ